MPCERTDAGHGPEGDDDMKTVKKRAGPSREPQFVTPTVWYYEERSALLFCVECRDECGYHKTIQFKVPVKMLRPSLDRIGPAKNKRSPAPAKE